jgi:undecaprenyl-diphosphooligosaccharide---protein glycotransferase
MGSKKKLYKDKPDKTEKVITMPPDATPAGKNILKIWQWMALFLLAFLLCSALRLIEVPARQLSIRQLDGIPLMQNPDSYAWLAGAKKINQYSDSPLSEILRIIHTITGLDIGLIGFYLPLLMAPLVVIPVGLLAIRWRMPEALLISGVMAGASFGFLLRTQTGWLDTDVFTLFLPVCFAVCLIIWLEPLIRITGDNNEAVDRRKVYAGALLLGILLRIYFALYPSGEVIGLSLLACAAFTCLVFARKGLRYDIAVSMGIILIAGGGAIHGLIIVSCIALLAIVKPDYFMNRNVMIAIVAVLALSFFFSFDLQKKISGIWFHLSRYGKISSHSDILILPSTIETVAEAKAISMKNVVRLLACNWILLIAGTAGFLYCIWRRPSALVFAPLLIVGLLGTKLGWRFTMYGGVVFGIGLGFGIVSMLRSFGLKTSIRWIVQMLLLIFVLWSIRSTIVTEKPALFLTKEYAQTLKELRTMSSPDAQIWIWWDWGYAAQYFTERMTFADGSRNTAEYTVPLAHVHFTPSPLHAYQLISFTAGQQKTLGPVHERHTAIVPLYHNPFTKLPHKKESGNIQDFMQNLKTQPLSNRQDISGQYLIVSWDNLEIAREISIFGTWDFSTGASTPGQIIRTKGKIKFDMQKGILYEDEKPFKVSAADLLSEHGRKHYAWPENKNGVFVIRNAIIDVMYLMDESVYNSLMVQMLIREPETFEPYFKLVIDRFPFIRAYRLNPVSKVS